MSVARVTDITIYPVKSGAGYDLQSAVVERRGLAGDRRIMIVDSHGEFVTAREVPRLTQIHARLDDGILHLACKGAPDIAVALGADAAIGAEVSIWDDRCTGVALGEDAATWFTGIVGTRCQVVQMTEACPRPINALGAQSRDEVSFADAYPLLLISKASLADLNARVGEPLSMRRFRPNLVVDRCPAFAEDDWRSVRIGEVSFDVAKACARCKLTTIDPETAERHPDQEPLRTLATYRREGGEVLFGQNLIPRSIGTVRVGDEVTLR